MVDKLIDYSKDLNQLSHTEVQLHTIQEKHALLAIRIKALEERKIKAQAQIRYLTAEIEKAEIEAVWCFQEAQRIVSIRKKELQNEEGL